MYKTILSVIALCISGAVGATLPPIENFTKANEYYNAVLSPDGKYIAVERAADQGKRTVAIVKTDSLSVISHIPATNDRSPTNPRWANNERVVVSFTKELKRREHEAHTGELTAMDADGSKLRNIIQHTGLGTINGKLIELTSGKGRKRGNMLLGFARVIHQLPGEKKNILIRFQDYHRGSKDVPLFEYYKINTVTGKVKFIVKAPSEFAHVTFSATAEPRFSLGLSKAEKSKNVLIAHRFISGKWEALESNMIEGAEEISIIGETGSANAVFLKARFLHKTDRIYRYNIETGEKTLAFAHGSVDPGQLVHDRNTNTLVAVHFEDGEPNLHLIDEEHLYSKWYPSLFSAFDGKRVRITSSTLDDSQLIIHVSGANEPGQFHLFNTSTKKMRYLFNAASWVDTDSLSETQPIQFKSRDGLDIHGYLTKPKSLKTDMPLIVYPHGGPHGPRDKWTYNSEVQFLASRGYAVLQVNFRGSGGYGLGFEKKGYRQWGAEIQYDIIDGTRWAMKQDEISRDRVCIMGASFGGYSALMSPIIEPDLFKCAIGFVGVYDLNLMYTTGDIERLNYGENYLDEVIGHDKTELDRFSPLKRVDELKAPVLLIHGEEDWRVDVKHYHEMKKALEEKNHPLETMLIEKEGHGFANEKNRIEFLKRVEIFLATHLTK
ncbi:MAG: dipeptidyl aminopeptidase/acylaminoacyl peptidase [Flavobacteriales bacterium]|jgi:dipeptidyl aminopeptidase/acylaminoacyl peptidase